MNEFSVSGKNWVSKSYSSEKVNFLKDNFNLSEIISKLIAIRDIKIEDVNIFLKPKIKNFLPNPFILKDMEKTVNRTVNALENNEKIGIFGDYDVDGATSTALLGNYFNKFNQNIEVYIPDRKSEGYGPNKKAFDKMIQNGSKLIFTVDCGTMSYEAIEYAKKKHTDVIVLDHHQSELKLPNAFSVVNPNRFDDESKLNYLCAAGVCFMFLIALNKKLRELKWFNTKKVNEPNLLDYLDLVSLGTVCDVVPLVGLNRAIVSQGLELMKKKTNLGLKTLKNICGIDSNITVYDLGYKLGPRINAGGRVGKCSHGVNLFLSKDSKETFKIASELELFNKQRKQIENEMIKKIENKIKIDPNDPIIFLSGHNWHGGIIGIIASRLKDKYNKPAIIISFENGLGKASARSILGFDIGSLIISAVHKNLLKRGGGHKMAGGFSIDEDKLQEFKDYVSNKFLKNKKNLIKNDKLFFDSKISPSALNENFFCDVNALSPFGSGNPEPKFVIEDLNLLKSTIVGEKHIKSLFSAEDGSVIKSVTFNAIKTDLETYLMSKNTKKINIFGKLSLNQWKGQKNVEFIIDDISVNKTINNTVPSSNG
ncbi:MAG: single-stranded-DNA-specific exonuclease RecJ [Candidatus Marinimicrobia bacterium]|nr:single-stranded-DNA-specific exonuclease RecJ [Candidatus Neomarinimicrobiota bacterium]